MQIVGCKIFTQKRDNLIYRIIPDSDIKLKTLKIQKNMEELKYI